ncbi:2-hydroxychromene-2-carboxylate isomerase [Bradyrhizobium liaoningense]|uniref:2-hydroxychromene-2-carboxylate isomerase n=1 Tax=Bradyrhizobium liaoningense TaxID=43992 RepID=UPI001BAB08FA|nr:2-hydroxychromene-2-carboxylate isomerase [Bradyrhizobium liaoningense]MBR0822699.1 2-hydroxychromene-2-carboxylate isomerase [Bradyrhizobium liaoningense]
MGKIIEFYWDLGSTNSYFALHLIKPVAKKHDATVVPHPFNLGYVFRKQNYVLMEEPKVKLRSRKIDLMRWARRYNLPFQMPTKFPMKTSPALRGALAMRRLGKEWEFMEKIFAAYWERNDASVGELAGLTPIAVEQGVDPAEFERLVESDEIRDELIAETDRGLERGVFGVPTFFVGEQMFWGKDRMEFIDDELTSPTPPRARRSTSQAAV